MRNTLLISVAAAALIAGAGLASAQAPSPAPAAQQSAPAEKTAPMKEPKGASEIKAPDAGKKATQADEKMERKGGKAQKAEGKSGADVKADGKTKADMKADGKTKADVKPDGKTKADVKADPKSSEKAGDAKPSTSGQGAAAPAGASASLSSEQRTTIRTVIQKQNVQRVTNVNFSISVGTRVPRTVHFYPVPVELVQIHPGWRGYQFFLVGDQIIVVNPRTLEIVAVLEV